MGVTTRARTFALSRPHLFVVEGRGGTEARLAVERWARAAGWPVALTPRDADIVVICGHLPSKMGEAFERVRITVPYPREIVSLSTPDVAETLSDAARRLTQWSDQRRAAAEAVVAEGVPFRKGDVGPGLFKSNVGEGPAAGLDLAYRSDDRDGIRVDVVHFSLGPILAAWPSGLRMRARVQGDVVQAVAADVDSFVGAGERPSFWDRPWVDALAAERVSIADAERHRAASHLDSMCRFLSVMGDPRHALRAARLRDEVLEGVDVHALRKDVARFSNRLRRARLLNRFTDGLGVLPKPVISEERITGPAARASGEEIDARAGSSSYPGFTPVVALGRGDVRSRWHQWLAEIEQSLGLVEQPDRALEPVDGRVEGPRGVVERSPGGAPSTARMLSVLEDLLLGQVWSGARMIVASFDPDAHQLAASRDAHGMEAVGA